MSVNRISVLFFAFAYFCGLCTGSQHEFAGNGFYPAVGGWMRLNTEPADWLTARINCHMEGEFLASPWSEKFTSVVGDLLSRSLENLPVYSGVHSTYAEGALVYVDGKPRISLNPQDLAPLERCGVFFANGTTGQVPCDQQLPYICFVPEPEFSIIPVTDSGPKLGPALSLTLETNCGERSLGYEFSEKTGKCYKFHAQSVHTWEDAKIACTEEDAQLAIINSKQEAQVLSDLFKRFPAEKIFGAQYTDTVAIGFYKETNEFGDDYWKTIEGETLEEAGYASWQQGSPHPWATLGFINRDGLLYGYVRAIRDVPFICEKKPSVELDDSNHSSSPTPTPETETEQATESTTSRICEMPGYEFFEFSGNCYKFHEEDVKSIDEAQIICGDEMANVAEVNSDEELSILMHLYRKNPMKNYPLSETSSVENWIYRLKDRNNDAMDLYKLNFEFTERNNKVYAYNLLGVKSRFICEIPSAESKLESVTPTPEPVIENTPKSELQSGSTSKCEGYGYEYFDLTGNCYKYYEAMVDNIDSAQRLCNYDMANIAEVHNKDEEIYVTQIFYSKPLSSFASEEGSGEGFMDHQVELFEGNGKKYALDLSGGMSRFICEKPSAESKLEFVTPTPEPVIESTPKPELQSGSTSRCEGYGYEYFDLTGNCYKYYEAMVDNIDSAQRLCSYDMANIAEVDNNDEEIYVTQIFNSNPFNGFASEEGSGEGFMDHQVEFFERNGKKYARDLSGDSMDQVEFFKRNGKKYARDLSEDFMDQVKLSERNGKKYAHALSGGMSRFICEKPSVESKPPVNPPEPVIESEPKSELVDLTVKCGEDNFGYEYVEQTGRCYKFHAESVYTWFDAKEACEAELAHLAIVNSKEEADTLSKLFANYPPNKITGAQYTDTAAIGYFYNENSNEWQTLDGETLEQAGYNSWRPNAPFISARFGFIARDGLLYGYVPAVRDMPFICEKAPVYYLESEVTTPKTEHEFETATAIARETDNVLQPELETASPPTLSCGNPIFGYKMFDKIKICYKSHVQAVDSINRAKMICKIDGAMLAKSRSYREIFLYEKLYKKDFTIFDPEDGDNEDYYSYQDDMAETTEATDDASKEESHYSAAEVTAYKIRSDGSTWLLCQKEPVEEFRSTSAKPEFELETEISIATTTGTVIQTIPETETETAIEADTEIEGVFGTGTATAVETSTENEAESVTAPKIVSELENATDLLSMIPICGNKDLGYEYSEKTGQCYKFHSQSVDTWFDALIRCYEENAYLAIINSDEEAQTLADIFSKYPAEKVNAQNTDIAAIGIYKHGDFWQTIQNEMLEEAGYASWSQSPNLLAAFGYINRDGLLSAYGRDIRNVLFICEKNPMNKMN